MTESSIADQTRSVLDKLSIADVECLFAIPDKEDFDEYVKEKVNSDSPYIEHILTVIYPGDVDMVDVNKLRTEIEDGYYDYPLYYYLSDRIPEAIDVLTLMGNYIILNIKVITDVFESLKGTYQAHTSIYTRRFICPCKRSFEDIYKDSDIRLKIRCCPYCGRSSKTWELVSARLLSLQKTIKSNKWYRKDKILIRELGYEISNHSQDEWCDLYSRLISNEEIEQRIQVG